MRSVDWVRRDGKQGRVFGGHCGATWMMITWRRFNAAVAAAAVRNSAKPKPIESQWSPFCFFVMVTVRRSPPLPLPVPPPRVLRMCARSASSPVLKLRFLRNNVL